MKASEANEMAFKAHRQSNKEYKKIINNIEFAAGDGRFSIEISEISAPVLKLLKADGYEIDYYGGMLNQQRYKISW